MEIEDLYLSRCCNKDIYGWYCDLHVEAHYQCEACDAFCYPDWIEEDKADGDEITEDRLSQANLMIK